MRTKGNKHYPIYNSCATNNNFIIQDRETNHIRAKPHDRSSVNLAAENKSNQFLSDNKMHPSFSNHQAKISLHPNCQYLRNKKKRKRYKEKFK